MSVATRFRDISLNICVSSTLQDAATSGKHVALVSNFVDRYYNRSSYTLAAYEENLPALCDAGVGIAKVALESIDMHAHKAKHPRLGTVDHISCHSMHTSRGDRAPADNAALASSVGRALGSQLKVPVMLYGSVTAIRTGGHETTVSLAELRRSQGYFERVPDRDVDDEWSGLPSKLLRDAGASGRIAFGPQGQIDGRVGVACVGSVPWVTNFNVQLDTDSMDIAKVCQFTRIAAAPLQFFVSCESSSFICPSFLPCMQTLPFFFAVHCKPCEQPGRGPRQCGDDGAAVW